MFWIPEIPPASGKPRFRVKMGRRVVRQEPEIILRVRGNCGVYHSFEAWQQCNLCKLPPVQAYTRPMAFWDN